MTSPANLQIETDARVATITLNRPPVNALSLALLEELETALTPRLKDWNT